MSVKSIILCDECGAERKEVNHWFTALQISKSSFWSFVPFQQATADPYSRHDLCGQKCATEAFQRLLTTGSVRKAGVDS